MLKNYFKIAMKVLGRNRFYTFVSLFGISFTLMVLMLSTSFMDNELGANAPLSKKERILIIPIMGMKQWKRETITTVDTLYRNDSIVLDTVLTENIIKGDYNQSASSSLSYDFCKEYIMTMKTPELVSIYSSEIQIEVYPNDVRMEMTANMVDANYWRIFDFEFIEGHPFNESAVENQSRVIVLTEEAARQYFGKQESYVGREMMRGHELFKVVGVVRKPNTSSLVVRADAYMPHSLLPPSYMNYDWGYFGYCDVALLAPDAASREAMAAELRQIENNTELVDDFDTMRFWEKSITDLYAWPILGGNEKRMGNRFVTILMTALILFLIIPIINLINLNITRILERSSEIGVRKAFGARTDHLLFQFIFENVLLTLIGGAIGCLFSLLVMKWLNRSEILNGTLFEFNARVFLISLLITILFGILSGIVPAWNMARKEIASTIKNSSI